MCDLKAEQLLEFENKQPIHNDWKFRSNRFGDDAPELHRVKGDEMWVDAIIKSGQAGVLHHKVMYAPVKTIMGAS